MKLTADYKWRRLRAWVRERARHEQGMITTANPGFSTEYHRHRADVFKAVLLVMDAENKRVATRPMRKPQRSA